MDLALEKIALSMTEGVTSAVVARLDRLGIGYDDFFKLDMRELQRLLGVTCRFEEMKRQEALARARVELRFMQNHQIRALFVSDEDYPVLLREIPDAPVVIYVLGKPELNTPHAFNVVGTRRCTSYGLNFTREFVADMAAYFPDAVVFSGLAYGIDAAAHQAALDSGLRTVAVVAHGLDTLYPAAHKDLARRIIKAGGSIVTEYPSTTRPLQRNFLERNRIIAGLSELTIIAESEVRGGAMNTAAQAFSYSREVVALPGRYSDQTSSGCNRLISRSTAHIFTSVAEVAELMGWPLPAFGKSLAPIQRNIFPELEDDAATIYSLFKAKSGSLSIDEIHVETHLPMPVLISTLTEMEFDGLISKLPGARYELI